MSTKKEKYQNVHLFDKVKDFNPTDKAKDIIMKVIPKNLTDKDIGRWVDYDNGFEKDKGKIKSWNEKWIFVVYNCGDNWDDFNNYTGCATKPEDLTFI